MSKRSRWGDKDKSRDRYSEDSRHRSRTDDRYRERYDDEDRKRRRYDDRARSSRSRWGSRSRSRYDDDDYDGDRRRDRNENSSRDTYERDRREKERPRSRPSSHSVNAENARTKDVENTREKTRKAMIASAETSAKLEVSLMVLNATKDCLRLVREDEVTEDLYAEGHVLSNTVADTRKKVNEFMSLKV